MRELLFQTKFTPERVNIVAQRLINNVAEVKRRGNAMVSDLMTGIIYKKGRALSVFLRTRNKIIYRV